MLPLTDPSLGLMGEAVFFTSVGLRRGRHGTVSSYNFSTSEYSYDDWFYNVFEIGVGLENSSKGSMYCSMIQLIYYHFSSDSGKTVSSYNGNGLSLNVGMFIKF